MTPGPELAYRERWVAAGRSLAEDLRLNEHNLALRRAFIRLSDDDRRLLARLAPWADRVADRIAARFYDHQFSFSLTREFFERFAQRRGITLVELRQRLERTQAAYFRSIFTEAANGGDFGPEYYAMRLRIGAVHNRIDLPLKWYLGSYALYSDLVREELRRAFRFRPWFRSRAERAIFTVFNYDLQAVAEAFFLDYLRSIGLDLSTIPVPRLEMDLTDQHGLLRQCLREAVTALTESCNDTAQLSERLASTSSRLDEIATSIAESAQYLATALQDESDLVERVARAHEQIELASTSIASGAAEQQAALRRVREATHLLERAIAEIAARANRSAQTGAAALRNADEGRQTITGTLNDLRSLATAMQQLADQVERLNSLASQVGQMGQAIEEIAEQTNLLALNAAIEAARAGEAGKGFAVVAEEVRKLAERAKDATTQILGLVGRITGAIDEATQTARHSAERAERGTQLAAEAERAVQAITEGMRSLVAELQGIDSGVSEIRQSSAHVVQLLETVASVTSEHTAAAEELRSTMRSVLDQWQLLEQHLRSNQTRTQDLATQSDLLAELASATARLTALLENQARTLTTASQAFAQAGGGAVLRAPRHLAVAAE